MFYCENVLVVDRQGDEDSQKRPGKKRNVFGHHSQERREETVHILGCSLNQNRKKKEEEEKKEEVDLITNCVAMDKRNYCKYL